MVRNLIEKLYKKSVLTTKEYEEIFANSTDEDVKFMTDLALKVKEKYYGNGIFLRGIIEFSNYCKNDCFYCGIRGKNKNIERYRLTKEEILSCCKDGYDLGIRTFVLQGGEDPFFSTDFFCEIIKDIKGEFPDCAVTLSIGEKSKEEYEKLFNAGGNRFLLREETANQSHYEKLHPENMSFENRKNCLFDIKKVGFHTGGGFMVGSPYQSDFDLAMDLSFLAELQPHMVGIGPFVPHKDSIFKDFEKGSLKKTIIAIALSRLTLKKAMIPSTTALETISENGRIKGFLAGANVIMVNITPEKAKEKYLLYDNKAFVNKDAKDCIDKIKSDLKEINMELLVAIGNPID